MFLVSSEQQSSLLTGEETLAKGQGTGCYWMNCYFVYGLSIGWLAVIKCHWKDYWLFYCRSHKTTFRQSIGNMKTSWSWGGHIPASVNKNWPSHRGGGESTCSLGWQVTFYRRLLQLWYRISQINVQRIVFHFFASRCMETNKQY